MVIVKRYFLLFVLLAQAAFANTIDVVDPITWKIEDPINSPVFVSKNYAETYRFTSNLEQIMTQPFIVEKKDATEFTYDDNCSNKYLKPQETCTVKVNLFSTTTGEKRSQLTLTYYRDVVPLPARIIDVKSGPNITGYIDPKFPAVLEFSANNSYPVSFYFTNNGTQAATQVSIGKKLVPDTLVFSEVNTKNDCRKIQVLNPNDTCTISGQVKSKAGKDKSRKAATQDKEVILSVDFNFAQGKKTLTTRAVMNPIAVNGNVDTPLPKKGFIGHNYPVQFSFTNNGSTPVTQVSLTKQYPAEFTETSNTCADSLAVNTSCKVQGTFKATKANPYLVALSFKYKEGLAINVSTATVIDLLAVSGDIKPTLPANIIAAVKYPVQFNINNESDADVTNINISKSYPDAFIEDQSTKPCPENGGSLTANTSCTINGTYFAQDSSAPDPTIAVTFAYREASKPLKLSVAAKINKVALSGKLVTPLPSTTSIGNAYPVKFKFTNPSNVQVTGVNVSNQFPEEFVLTKDTCSTKNNFPSHDSCVIEGNLTPQSTGNYQVSSTIHYNQGPDIPLFTTTQAIAVEVQGKVDYALPINANLHVSYPVAFRFTNESALAATDIQLTADYPADFKQKANTCQQTLTAGSSCVVQGQLTPTSSGKKRVAVTFTYHEGKPIPLYTETNVNDVAIVGAIKHALPKATTLNTPYKVSFEFQNTGTSTAHAVKVTPLADGKKDRLVILKNNCGTRLIAEQSCQVSGIFYLGQELGSHYSGVALSYQEGDSIVLKTSTMVGTPLLVAAGLEGYTGTSPDGKTWKKFNLSSNINLTAITWSDDCQRYLAVGYEQAKGGIAMLSTDGQQWEKYRTSSAYPNRVLWNKTLQQFIVVGKAGIVETSDASGKYWTRCDIPVGSDLNSVVWNESLHQYVIVGTYGVILTSSDGVHWQIESSKVSDNLTGIAWSDRFNKYVVVTTTEKRLLTSKNAKDWQTESVNAFDRPNYDVVWSPDFYQFASAGRFSTICTSDDENGISWSKRYSVPGGFQSYSINNIIWSHNLSAYFAVDLNSYLYSSQNGVYWDYRLLDGDAPDGGRAITGISDGVWLPVH